MAACGVILAVGAPEAFAEVSVVGSAIAVALAISAFGAVVFDANIPWLCVVEFAGHPSCSCSQHQAFLASAQDISQLARAAWQSKRRCADVAFPSVAGHPSCWCLQHQAFLSSDQAASALSRPAWQSKRASSVADAGAKVVLLVGASGITASGLVVLHPRCWCSQHQSFLSLGHTPDVLAKAAWQSKSAAPALTVWLVLAAGALPPGSAAEDGAAPGGACACETATLLLAPTESGKASAEYTSAWSPVVFCSRRSAAAGYHREGGPVT
mmetsp:Transcript_106486/g.343571  ORF Transcript_106486/g.343571 Transcript_106486/m.343571 type:complete len:268 (+) Transcript_106486:1186-1989(+)